MVIFSVNIHENLHASTYGIYNYRYEVQKMPLMATLSYDHFGNPGRSYHHAHYSSTHVVHWKQAGLELSFLK